MKILRKPSFILFIALCLISCEYFNNKKASTGNERIQRITNYKSEMDSLNKKLAWKKTNFNLWKSKNGDLAIKTQVEIEQDIDIEKYITELCCDGKKIKNVIDTLTFKYLGSSFYKDKNNVYTHYLTSDGGNFWIVEGADAKTFQVIGSCYAKDKKYIYGERTMRMDSVNYNTFKTNVDCGCYSKDKNGFYFWDKIIDTTDVDVETKKIIDKLKKL